jgi:hypothetical protein
MTQFEIILSELKDGPMYQLNLVDTIQSKYGIKRQSILTNIFVGCKKGIFKNLSYFHGNSLIGLPNQRPVLNLVNIPGPNKHELSEKITQMSLVLETVRTQPPMMITKLAEFIARKKGVNKASIQSTISRAIREDHLKLIASGGVNKVVLKDDLRSTQIVNLQEAFNTLTKEHTSLKNEHVELLDENEALKKDLEETNKKLQEIHLITASNVDKLFDTPITEIENRLSTVQ